MVTSPLTPSTPKYSSEELAERGWRIEEFTASDGTIDWHYIPLTEAEFLHPKEGYHLPSNTFHERIIEQAKDLLCRRYESHADVGIFSDLLIEWDIANFGDLCPDVFVAFGIRDKQVDRSAFNVEAEGVRPQWVLEVVSPRYRSTDREKKVLLYAQASVREYIIVDRRKYRGQIFEEVLGYRLVSGQYQPITPDEDGRISSETLGLWISLREGSLVMEDVQTGERLLGPHELQAQLAQAQQKAEDLAALLARYQEQFGELPES
jgi:Uma2 family endonuclease